MNTNKTENTLAMTVDGVAPKLSKAGPLAARLGLNKKTLFRWAEAGHLSRFKINERIVLFDENEVARFIEKGRVVVNGY